MFKTNRSKGCGQIIGSLKKKNSSGYEEVSITVVKAAIKKTSKILYHLMHSLFIPGIFPNNLKIAKSIPLRKKDETRIVANYRPCYHYKKSMKRL